jgi:hypothetical protein
LQFAQVLEQVKPQTPETHFAVLFGPAGQTEPQAPQCCGLLCLSTHWPPQLTRGAVQASTHWPLWHTFPATQATAQPPQLELSACVFTQALPHFVKPALQSKLHWPEAHSGKPLGGAGVQAVPHDPQFGSWVGLTQALPHLMSPPVQLKPHWPLEQKAWPPGGALQALPQPPQFRTSEPVATHWPLQFVVLPEQVRVHVPLEQTLPPVHTVPQPPQLLLSVCLLTQLLPQRARPVPQLAVQTPLTQAMLPPAGAVGQMLAHVPQLLASFEVLTQAPLHFT